MSMEPTEEEKENSEPEQEQEDSSLPSACNALLIGKSGSGKTRSIETLPGNVVHCSWDPTGYRSFRRKYKIFRPAYADEVEDYLRDKDPEKDPGLAVIDYASAIKEVSLDLKPAARYIQQKANMAGQLSDLNMINSMDCVQSLAIDSLTGMSNTILGFTMSTQGHSKMTQEDWGLAINKILEILDTANSGNKNFVLTAHMQVVQDQLMGGVKEQVLVFGKQLPEAVPNYFDTVFMALYKFNSYVWQTTPTDTFPSLKCRLHDNLPEFIEPNFEDLINGTFRQAGGSKK